MNERPEPRTAVCGSQPAHSAASEHEVGFDPAAGADGAGVCLLSVAIVLARARHWWSAAVCLGLAAGAKMFGLVLAPLVLARACVRYWLLALGLLFAACWGYYNYVYARRDAHPVPRGD